MPITPHDRRRLARGVALTAMPALLTGARGVCAELTLTGRLRGVSWRLVLTSLSRCEPRRRPDSDSGRG